MAAGRPTTYTQEMLADAREYLEVYKDKGEPVPTVVGLCKHIGRSKTCVYDWAKEPEKAEFSDILATIEEEQHIQLVAGGLSNGFNPTITKMMMTKHGYSDKQEIQHSGEVSQPELKVTVVNKKD